MSTTTEEDKWLDPHCWRNKSRLYRYFAMLNLMVLGFGQYVAYDILGSLQDAIMSQMDLSAQDFSILLSVGAWPTIVLCSFGGFLIDRLFGIQLGTFLYSCLFTLGHFVFALGVLLSTFWLAVLGRFIFWIGVEVVNVCAQYYSVIYFEGKELSLVLCITLAISRLGSSAVYELSVPLLDLVRVEGTSDQPGYQQPGLVIFIVGTFGVMSVMSSVVLAMMRPRREGQGGPGETIRIKDILDLGIPYWLVNLSGCSAMLNVYILLPFSQSFFMTVHGLGMEAANKVSSSFYLIGLVLAPLVGYLVDRKGREISMAILGFVLGLISHLLLALSTLSPYFAMFILSVSFSLLTAALIPLVAYIVPKKTLGTAYGMNQAMINLCFSVMILLSGLMVDKYGYEALELISSANAAVGLVSSSLLWIHNYRTGGSLDWSATRRRQQLDKESKKGEAAEPLNGRYEDPVTRRCEP